ncbi:MAGUK p55 subfamily member 4-like [Coregonus clupeaformis]|uniref:MAGUK p55 subfamily member 4-like n=1 Tax=Coregonus clupeaformis TaxID=59861 RepID=UPI001BE0A466|nr:MAGUK p55 subfamily member 4-like [Coregonus clupeaformis]
MLSNMVQEVRLAINSDISGSEVLYSLLSAPWLQSLLKVYECLLKFRRLPPSPYLLYASGLSHEILSNIRAAPAPSPEARRLYNLLKSPHLQALLSAHDTVAQTDYEPVLPPLPEDLPEDEEAMRIVCLVKNKQPLGATIKKDEDTGEIFIARVIHGGLADRSGLLHPGDLLVEVNGNPVEGLDPEQVIQILVQSQGTILFKVIPNTPQSTKSQQPALLYVRAMVDYCPLQDPAIPCPDAGMVFSRGDLLEIVDQTDVHWWQARKLPSTSACAGLIPSTSLFKSKQRETWWSQPFQAHTCIKPLNVVGDEDDVKTNDEKGVTADEEDFESVYSEEAEEGTHMMDGVYISGFRRSFRLWRRMTSCSPNSWALSSPYEEVVSYQRQPDDPHRLVILVGPSGVGVNELRKRLIKLNPHTFQGNVPHTTRPARDGEETGREYHFVTKELFDYMVCNHRFLEYGEYKGHLYGASIDAVRDVIDSGRMCVIDIQPHSILSVRNKTFKPYVVFIKPPSKERLRETRREARIFTSHVVNRPFKDVDFEKMEDAARFMEEKYGQFFDSVIVNEGLQDACIQLFNTIQLAQEGPQWIPATWLCSDD